MADRVAGEARAGEPRTSWVRYRMAKDGAVLTFRVPEDTPIILDESGWHSEREAAAAPSLDVETLTSALVDAEDDDQMGPEYRPERLAAYLHDWLARLAASEKAP